MGEVMPAEHSPSLAARRLLKFNLDTGTIGQIGVSARGTSELQTVTLSKPDLVDRTHILSPVGYLRCFCEPTAELDRATVGSTSPPVNRDPILPVVPLADLDERALRERFSGLNDEAKAREGECRGTEREWCENPQPDACPELILVRVSPHAWFARVGGHLGFRSRDTPPQA